MAKVLSCTSLEIGQNLLKYSHYVILSQLMTTAFHLTLFYLLTITTIITLTLFQMADIHALWALQLLVSSSLLAKIMVKYDEKGTEPGMKMKSQCKIWKESESDLQCSQLTGGVVSYS